MYRREPSPEPSPAPSPALALATVDSGAAKVAYLALILNRLLFGRIADGSLPQLDGHVIVKREGRVVNDCYSKRGKEICLAEKADAIRTANDPLMDAVKATMAPDLLQKLAELTPPDFLDGEDPGRVGVYFETSDADDQERLREVFETYILPMVTEAIQSVMEHVRDRQLQRQILAAVAETAPWDMCTCLAAMHLVRHPTDTVEFVSMGFTDRSVPGGTKRHQEYPIKDGGPISFRMYE